MDEDRRGRVCLEVLKLCCRRLYFELRFLERAIFCLKPVENEGIFFGSDGVNLYYRREYLLERYLQTPEGVFCDYLHTVIHCLYQHPFQAYRWEKRYWDLASDIAAADVLREIDVPWISGQISDECLAALNRIKVQVPVMSAHHIASYLQSRLGAEERTLEYLEELFLRDSHMCWIGGQAESDVKDGGSGEKGAARDDGAGGEGAAKDGGAGEEDAAKDGGVGAEGTEGETDAGGLVGYGNSADGSPSAVRSEAEIQAISAAWRDMAESAVLNADSFSKGQGDMPGSMRRSIQKLTREQYDYTEFLRKFAVFNECMRINMDEFDYSYYLYGLRLLGKIPLIEPLEYKEVKQIREFVIALDTSGSCSGKLIERFLTKTYNILCQTDSFADRAVLHIIQCDARIQKDVRIDSPEHMEEYIQKMELRGGGGTDFRPVFDYVEKLCEEGELKKLCGLLYFTDGYGIFPERPPDYKTAFVFVERDDEVRVPPWAMRLYLEDV